MKITRYEVNVTVEVPTDEDGPDISKRDLERSLFKLLKERFSYPCDVEVMTESVIEEGSPR